MLTVPKGYTFSTARAGFRPPSQGDKDDVALVLSETDAAVAAVFTSNQFPAAPVIVARDQIRQRATARAVLINAGLANACTGESGLATCRATQELVAAHTGIQPEDVLPASTGVIGFQFDMSQWKAVIPALASRLGSGSPESFTEAIMTTDAFPKYAHHNLQLARGMVTLTGMAKGAGMICPDMATMLCVLLCDVQVDSDGWRTLLRQAVDATFNRVTVDGDTSTNDTVYALANGCSGVTPDGDADTRKLLAAMKDVLGKLAYMLVQDGEGSSKVAHITVTGAATDKDAEQVARTVGQSPLVKTALYGCDPNWGRIVMAIGRSGVKLDPDRVRVMLCNVEVFKDGQPTGIDVDAALAGPMQERDIHIAITLGNGPGVYTLLASDLGHEYVDCNASYRS